MAKANQNRDPDVILFVGFNKFKTYGIKYYSSLITREKLLFIAQQFHTNDRQFLETTIDRCFRIMRARWISRYTISNGKTTDVYTGTIASCKPMSPSWIQEFIETLDSFFYDLALSQQYKG